MNLTDKILVVFAIGVPLWLLFGVGVQIKEELMIYNGLMRWYQNKTEGEEGNLRQHIMDSLSEDELSAEIHRRRRFSA